MNENRKKGLLRRGGICLFLAFFAAGLLIDPKGSAEAARSGIVLSVETIIPSLFPFFVLSGLVLKLPFGRLGKLSDGTLCRLFAINGDLACAYLLGLIGGYPVGARAVVESYRNKRTTKADAQRVLGYANNCGPAFFLSVVGIVLFQSAAVGAVLYSIHVLASVLSGILSRKTTDHTHSPVPTTRTISFAEAFSVSVRDGMTSVIHVSAFVILFSVLLHTAESVGLYAILLSPLKLLPNGWYALGKAALSGLIEVTCGVKALSAYASLYGLPVLVSFLLGFGGLCVHCQTISLFADTGLSAGAYLWAKLRHGALAALLTIPALSLIDSLRLSVPTFYIPYVPVIPVARPFALMAVYGSFFLIFLIFYYFLCRDRKKPLLFSRCLRYNSKESVGNK